MESGYMLFVVSAVVFKETFDIVSKVNLQEVDNALLPVNDLGPDPLDVPAHYGPWCIKAALSFVLQGDRAVKATDEVDAPLRVT